MPTAKKVCIAILLVLPMELAGQMTPIKFLEWGVKGQGLVDGSVVPVGQVWLIKAAGVVTDDGQQLEWMMQIKINNPQGRGGYWLVPLERQNGTASGTPVQAISREIILIAGECLSARGNGLRSDRQMGIVYCGWSFPESKLPKLLGAE